MATYSNPTVIGNTGIPPNTLGHNTTWPEGLCRDNSDNIYEVRGWDEAHHDIVKRDKGNGNIVWTSDQIISNYMLHGIAVDADGSWAYCTGSYTNNERQSKSAIFRFTLAPGVPRQDRDIPFTVAGQEILLYDFGSIPLDAPDQEPLHSIAVSGGSFWVTDSHGGRILKYDKVSGVKQQEIGGLPKARGLAIDKNGNILVGFDGNKVRSFTSGGSVINTATLTGQIVALSVANTTMAVAIRTEGIRTYNIENGQLLGSYGQPFRPGDNAGDRVKDVSGMVMLSDGAIIFSDRMGFNGRVQKAGGWIHLGLEFTAGASFHPDKPDRVISSSRHVYSLALDGKWSFLGNGMTEPYSPRAYFSHYESTHGGPPKIVKHGGSYFFYFPAGMSLAIYRLIENAGRGPSLQLCGCLCAGGQPGLDGTHATEPWLDKNRVTWQWTDPTGDGVIRSGDQEVVSAQDPGTYVYLNTCSVDNDGTLWMRELDKDCLSRLPVSSINSVGNPVYRWQDRITTFTLAQVQAAFGITDKVEFQDANRSNGDVYVGIKNHNPAWVQESGGWMGCNGMLRISPTGEVRWAKQNEFWQIGVAAIDGEGGYLCGSNTTSAGVNTIHHFNKDGNLVHSMRPDEIYGDHLGGIDSHQSVNVMRDPRDGQLKVFAADNMNQRIIVYSINDGSQPQPPDETMTVNLEWDAPNPPPASYALYKHTSGAPTKVGTSNTTTASVQANAGERLSVRSVGPGGESVDSNIVTVPNAPVGPPAPPTNLRIKSVT